MTDRGAMGAVAESSATRSGSAPVPVPTPRPDRGLPTCPGARPNRSQASPDSSRRLNWQPSPASGCDALPLARVITRRKMIGTQSLHGSLACRPGVHATALRHRQGCRQSRAGLPHTAPAGDSASSSLLVSSTSETAIVSAPSNSLRSFEFMQVVYALTCQ